MKELGSPCGEALTPCRRQHASTSSTPFTRRMQADKSCATLCERIFRARSRRGSEVLSDLLLIS
jgi:hypothetical protein